MPPRKTVDLNALPGPRNLALGMLAAATVARAESWPGGVTNSTTALVRPDGLGPGLAVGGHGMVSPGDTKLTAEKLGPSAGIPYISKQGLRTPLERMVHDMLSQVGQEDGDPAQVGKLIYKERSTGQRPQPDLKSLQQAMKKYKPEVVDQAIILNSFCGAKEQKIEDALKKCLHDVVKRCITLDPAGNSIQGTKKEHCDPYTSLSGRLPALANIARLAVLKATREVDHRYGVPIVQGPPAVLRNWGGALAIGEIGAVPDMPSRLGTIIATDDAALSASAGQDDLSIVKGLVHELFHALTDDRFDAAIQEQFPRHWNQLREIATEFVASHFVTHNATDAGHENRDGGNHFMIRVAEQLTKTSPLTEQAYETGTYTIKKALTNGEPAALNAFCKAVKQVIATYGPPMKWRPISEPESATAFPARTEPSSTSSTADSTSTLSEQQKEEKRTLAEKGSATLPRKDLATAQSAASATPGAGRRSSGQATTFAAMATTIAAGTALVGAWGKFQVQRATREEVERFRELTVNALAGLTPDARGLLRLTASTHGDAEVARQAFLDQRRGVPALDEAMNQLHRAGLTRQDGTLAHPEVGKVARDLTLLADENRVRQMLQLPAVAAHAPPQTQVELEARLEGTSRPKEAGQLLAISTVAREDFTPRLAAVVMGVQESPLVDLVRELQEGGLMDGLAPANKRVGELVLEDAEPSKLERLKRKLVELQPMARLSADALQLARIAAISGGRIDHAAAARLMGKENDFELLPAQQELQQAGMAAGDALTANAVSLAPKTLSTAETKRLQEELAAYRSATFPFGTF